jgi:cysteine desulfurase
MRKIYLDYSATTPAYPQVKDAMLPYLGETFGNPSSMHSCGQEAKVAVEKAREQVARLIGADATEIIFTSGGSEADNMALEGIAFASRSKGNHIVTTAIEHHAVLECCHFLESQGFNVTYLPIDQYGLVYPGDVESAIRPETILISIMLANNEIGTIQPVAEIASIAKNHGITFHTDAVQAVGHLPIDVNQLGVDLLAMSAHKLHGPKGMGALYVRRGTRLIPFIHGGAQEKGRRAGTENVAGIVGFGKAAELAQAELSNEMQRLTLLRDYFINSLTQSIKGMRLNGHPERRLPNNISISVDGVSGESMLLNLDLQGIYVSTGSACNSANRDPSHVLKAIGLSDELTHNSLRFSLGRWTTGEEIDIVIDTFARIVSKLRTEPPLEPQVMVPSPSAKAGKVVFKGDAIVIFPDVAASIKGSKVLNAAGINTKLVAPPPKLRLGCDLALEIAMAQKQDITCVFAEKEVPFIRIEPLS